MAIMSASIFFFSSLIFSFDIIQYLIEIASASPRNDRWWFCHSEPFACHSEQSEESCFSALGKLREESRSLNKLPTQIPQPCCNTCKRIHKGYIKPFIKSDRIHNTSVI